MTVSTRLRALAFTSLVMPMGCRSGEEAAAQQQRPAAPPVTVTPDAAVDAVPPDAPISALHLPRHDVDATKVLYGTVEEVRAVLGRGTPRKGGRWRYELGDGEFVVVVYEHGRALGIEMPTATPGWEHYDTGQRAAIAAWGHLRPGEQLRGHSVITGEPFVDSGLSIYDEDYWKRENAKIETENARLEAAARAKTEAEERAAAAKAEREERAAAERERRTRPAREGFVEQFAAMAASHGNLGFNVELGSPSTTLRIVGPCDGKILRFLVGAAGEHIRNVGFTRVECASSDSTWITP